MTVETPEVEITPPKPRTLGFIAAVLGGAFLVGVAVRMIGERLDVPLPFFAADDDDEDQDGEEIGA